MGEIFENKFAIKKIEKATDEDYLKALAIYNETTPIDIKTNTNEISYWIGRKPSQSHFELLIFTLYLDDKIIGMAMLCYIKKQRIVVYDYISLLDQYRLNAVFFTYISLIQNYIQANGYSVDYYVNEISNKHDGKAIDKESRLFKKLICLEGFGMVNSIYKTLPLGVDNFESSFDAFIHIKTSDIIKKISKDTFLYIIQGIYFEYYTPWYAPFLAEGELSTYKSNIDKIYDELKDKIDKVAFFDVIYPECPLLSNSTNDKTYGYLPSKEINKYTKLPLIIVAILVSPLIIVWGYSAILGYLEIPLSSANSVLGAILGAAVTSMTAFLIARR